MGKYNVIYVGFGPSTIFSLLSHSPSNCLVIEKGKSLKNRNPKEVLFGSGGAGAFSDSKLVANPLVGGDIKFLEEKHFYNLADQILKYYNQFSNNSTFNWMPEDDYIIPSKTLYLLKSKVCHIGTDRSKKIFQKIENHIYKNICPINFKEEVINIKLKSENCFEVITNKQKYLTTNVVIAVGKRSDLVTKIAKQLHLKNSPNKLQIGVRFEAPNKFLKELVEKFYDYKIVMNTFLGRWRTFCCNAKCAHVTVERNKEFVSVNGHAFANKPNNGLINFGIMGELNIGLTRKEQIKLMRKVNNGTNKLLAQGLHDFIGKITSSNLNYFTTLSSSDYFLGNLWDCYPHAICAELSQFLQEILKVYDLDGHFFAPEIKITNPIFEMGDSFQMRQGLYLAGDCSGYTRSIIQSGISGILIGQHLKERGI